MRTAIITFVIYTAIFLVVGGLIYFFAFFRPNTNRVEQLNRDIATARAELAAASQIDGMVPELQRDIERLGHELDQAQSEWDNISHEWQNNHMRFLPEVFDEWDIRERIDRIAMPHSFGLHVEFLYSQPLGAMSNNGNPDGLMEGVWLTPVNISFAASYEGLVAILQGFAHEGIDNRVVEYTLTRNWDQWDVVMRLDVLTQMPHPYMNSGNYISYSVEPSG